MEDNMKKYESESLNTFKNKIDSVDTDLIIQQRMLWNFYQRLCEAYRDEIEDYSVAMTTTTFSFTENGPDLNIKFIIYTKLESYNFINTIKKISSFRRFSSLEFTGRSFLPEGVRFSYELENSLEDLDKIIPIYDEELEKDSLRLFMELM